MLYKNAVLLLVSALSAASAAVVDLGNETFGTPSCGSGSVDNPVTSSECQGALTILFQEVCSGGVCELTSEVPSVLAAINTCEVVLRFTGKGAGVSFNQRPVSTALTTLVSSCNKAFPAGGSASPTVSSKDGQLQLSYNMNIPMDG
jgi:hypothetical protein